MHCKLLDSASSHLQDDADVHMSISILPSRAATSALASIFKLSNKCWATGNHCSTAIMRTSTNAGGQYWKSTFGYGTCARAALAKRLLGGQPDVSVEVLLAVLQGAGRAPSVAHGGLVLWDLAGHHKGVPISPQ